ncbi:putative membrane protein DUF2157 [Thiogranum longum]|uniref:Putative membrane protein DUF2157 n=1 Tax=Thiogranum longum TaxID=1537524 RepID=A0A4V2PGV3_9GAMM|nr:DUF2157 domain-containing protein [Thiogranum longum]TCK18266.1 putative membrane protein DUF2157 [Thiogranum longum]
MEPDSKAQAQQRANQIRSFQAEVARLEAEGVMQLSADQQRAIHTYHDDLLAGFSQTFGIDRNRQARQLSLGMRIASFLGALALAASIFFLFYQFWGRFGSTAQVSILVLASLATFSATGLIAKRDTSGYLG